jgi:hypothetical protein
MNILSDLIERVCLDSRIDDGIFSLENNQHLNILQEYLQSEFNINEEQSIELRNAIVEGKYPDRQAYNTNGLLVTFPTSEYKQRAIARGTHFEENPKKAADANIFDPQQEQPSAQQPPVEPQPTTSEPEAPSEKDKDEPDLRTPTEKQSDAQVTQKILTTEFTLDEAKSNGFYNKGYVWYTNEGDEVGIARYVEDLGKIIIRPKK